MGPAQGIEFSLSSHLPQLHFGKRPTQGSSTGNLTAMETCAALKHTDLKGHSSTDRFTSLDTSNHGNNRL